MARKKTSSRKVRPSEDACSTPALDRGLMALELLVWHRIPMRAIDMAQELGVPKGSLGRILGNLAGRGYIERDERTMTYSITSKLLAMGSSMVCEGCLVEESIDVMRDLRDATLEMVALQVPLNDREGVVLNTFPSRHPVRLTIDPGARFDFHNTAPGKVMLAFLPERDRARIFSLIKLTRETDRTITSIEVLKAEIDDVRKCGYALDRGECVEGIQCVSAPVYERNSTLAAALTIIGPSTRLSVSRLRELAPAVISHAGEISRRMGCERTEPGENGDTVTWRNGVKKRLATSVAS